MYIGLTVENFVTIGVMLIAWMIALHVLGQVGVHLGDYVPWLGN